MRRPKQPRKRQRRARARVLAPRPRDNMPTQFAASTGIHEKRPTLALTGSAPDFVER